MRCSQLTQWIIVVSLAACTSDPVRPSASFGPGSTPTGGTGGSAGGGATGKDADALDPGDSSTGSAGSMEDGSSDGSQSFFSDAPVALMHGDSSGAMCSGDLAAVGSKGLHAAGATPAAFADAFNAELTKLTTAGPFLVVLSGVNEGSNAVKTASFGALDVVADGVGFADPPAVVPFSIAADRMIQIAKHDAAFGLKFVAPAGAAVIPVVSVAMTGTLTGTCTSLTISALTLLVPAAAGNIAFGGSTVAALMGAASASVQGGTNNAWPLELSGKVKPVLAILPEDAGEGPL